MYPNCDVLYYHLHYILFLKIAVIVTVKVAGRFLLSSKVL